MPILKPFYYRTYGKAYVKARSIYKSLENLSIHIRRKYMDMIKGYEKGVIRHFCDALIEAKVEAINENKEWAPHLNDDNLSLVISDLFLGQSFNYI